MMVWDQAHLSGGSCCALGPVPYPGCRILGSDVSGCAMPQVVEQVSSSHRTEAVCPSDCLCQRDD